MFQKGKEKSDYYHQIKEEEEVEVEENNEKDKIKTIF